MFCRKHGVSSATSHKWKTRYGGLEESDARRLKVLGAENAKLKKLLAEAMLDNVMLKDIVAKKMVIPVARREAVVHQCKTFEASQRQGCQVIGSGSIADPLPVATAGRQPLCIQLRELAAVRGNFGYRRLHLLLEREGVHLSHKKLRRLYSPRSLIRAWPWPIG